jgi:MoaA/NifB/PqqE/SkfB family radical SAM enzyme
MCGRYNEFFQLDLSKEMSIDMFKGLLQNIDGEKEIILADWGEPLIHPDIIEMIKYAKSKSHKVSLTSNGMALDTAMQRRLIASGLDHIAFSVDSVKGNPLAHLNQPALKNIESFMRLKLGGNPDVTLTTTIHKHREQDVFDVLDFAKDAGINKVNLLRLDVRFNKQLEKPNAEEERKLFSELEKHAKNLGVTVNFLPIAVFDGPARFMYRRINKALYRFGRYCPETYNQCFVNIDGFVTPCVAIPFHVIGDLKKERLDDIWKNEKFKEFRNNYKRVCNGCETMF